MSWIDNPSQDTLNWRKLYAVKEKLERVSCRNAKDLDIKFCLKQLFEILNLHARSIDSSKAAAIADKVEEIAKINFSIFYY